MGWTGFMLRAVAPDDIRRERELMVPAIPTPRVVANAIVQNRNSLTTREIIFASA